MGRTEWFKQAKYGMMIHWGLYSLLAGEWQGQRTPFIGEWAQAYFRIPFAEYSKLAAAFNPIYFDAEQWVKLAADSGMKYLVITSKHHDGFALFHSKVSRYNIVDATPFGRDVIKELSEACKKYGVRFGLYYSQALDWEHPDGAGYDTDIKNEVTSWTNDWDYPDASKKDFARCFEQKIKPQVKEILTGYGDLCLIWFDVPFTITTQQSYELYQMVKYYQPDCLVNSRIGAGSHEALSGLVEGDQTSGLVDAGIPNIKYDYLTLGDNEISDRYFGDALVETAATLNDTWGYKTFDQNWKDAAEVKRLRNHLNERGINYLLNVGPDYLGRIPGPSCDILRAAAEK